jgi:hypothetical protein
VINHDELESGVKSQYKRARKRGSWTHTVTIRDQFELVLCSLFCYQLDMASWPSFLPMQASPSCELCKHRHEMYVQRHLTSQLSPHKSYHQNEVWQSAGTIYCCLNNRRSYINLCKNVMTLQLHLNKTSCQSSINTVYD